MEKEEGNPLSDETAGTCIVYEVTRELDFTKSRNFTIPPHYLWGHKRH